MKSLMYATLIVSVFTSCKRNTKIVENTYVDSLIRYYTLPIQVKENEADMQFWKNRIDPKQPRHVNESRYASTLVTRFHQFGDIQDVKQADSIYRAINKTFKETLGSPFAALTSTAMLQHRFMQADTLLQKARKAGIDGFTDNTLSFDVNFELGRYSTAEPYLNLLKRNKDYSYYFRKSKLDHLNGTIDSAINDMTKAADRSNGNATLKGIALSNVADLNIHAGNLQKAGELYKECIRLNSVDFHSMMGLGWVALVYDKNDTLAEKLFKFVQTRNKLPDPLFKLYQMAQARGDKALESKYANEFIATATDTIYGKMYNKYIIEIYTGILNKPAMAEELAKNELTNRATPQTYAWYAYTLFKNNKKDEAYNVFKQHISGQPLEGLELYYIGTVMKGLGKGYDAKEFYNAAEKNRYDLSPNMAKDLDENLKE